MTNEFIGFRSRVIIPYPLNLIVEFLSFDQGIYYIFDLKFFFTLYFYGR